MGEDRFKNNPQDRKKYLENIAICKKFVSLYIKDKMPSSESIPGAFYTWLQMEEMKNNI